MGFVSFAGHCVAGAGVGSVWKCLFVAKHVQHSDRFQFLVILICDSYLPDSSIVIAVNNFLLVCRQGNAENLQLVSVVSPQLEANKQ